MMDPVRDQELDRRSHVDAHLTQERVDVGWDRLRTRRKPVRSKAGWVAGGLVAVAAAAALFVMNQNDSLPQWAGTTLEAGAVTVAVQLEDGSEVVAEAATTLRKVEERADETRIALERGSATFEVTRNPARTFIVEADGVEVRVVGTRFRVSRGDQIEVRVERGAVDVVAEGEVVRLRAGDRWTPPPTEIAVIEPPEPEVEEPPRTRRVRSADSPSADSLFERARGARRGGDARDAARAYETFLRAHPRDTRASLASFELGRLKMDLLGDARGAVRAFERSLRDGQSPFRQEAMARIVEAQASLNAAGPCRRARQAYLRRYPDGRHRADVESACE